MSDKALLSEKMNNTVKATIIAQRQIARFLISLFPAIKKGVNKKVIISPTIAEREKVRIMAVLTAINPKMGKISEEFFLRSYNLAAQVIKIKEAGKR